MIGHGLRAVGMPALVDKVPEHAPHPLEIGDLQLDLGEAIAGDAPDRAAVDAVLEVEQLAHLVEREAELLRPLDEADALDEARRIAAEGAVARRHRQQSALLVVADRLDADGRGLGEPADRQRAFGHRGHRCTP